MSNIKWNESLEDFRKYRKKDDNSFHIGPWALSARGQIIKAKYQRWRTKIYFYWYLVGSNSIFFSQNNFRLRYNKCTYWGKQWSNFLRLISTIFGLCGSFTKINFPQCAERLLNRIAKPFNEITGKSACFLGWEYVLNEMQDWRA